MKHERILAVHDISCVGRCSLTVALPIISSVGIECSGLPTAVLSTHTGGFTGYTYRDLTEDMVPIDEHWGTLDITFDAFYTGFLGSFEQIDIVSRLFDDLSHEGTTIYVDPVMADGGKLYPVFGPDFPKGMRRLCEKADVIMPNLTELCLMLGEEWIPGPYTHEYVDSMIEKARGFGVSKVVLTGISFEEGQVGAVYKDFVTGETGSVMRAEIPGYYHGTGDVFGSALVGACECGLPLSKAVEAAVNLTVSSIIRTYESGEDVRYGVNFEIGLRDYIAEIDAGRPVKIRLSCTVQSSGVPHSCSRSLMPASRLLANITFLDLLLVTRNLPSTCSIKPIWRFFGITTSQVGTRRPDSSLTSIPMFS